MTEKIHIGTSGFSYLHWKENFYPKELPTKDWLDFYSQTFSTVELNTTFYHLPLENTVKNWHSQVPKNFLFALKASRYITHQKKLHDSQKSLQIFYQRIKSLKNKIGPILFQLPPSFKINKDLLLEFVTNLKPPFSYVFEFRHDSWYVDEIYDLLKEYDIALCITDLNGKLSPEEITSHFTYIRLHGPKKAYKGSYGSKLKEWKNKIVDWSSRASVYCYFDNDEKGFAVKDAKKLKKMLNEEQYEKN